MKIKFLNSPRFKHGSFATVITIGFVALVVLLNVIATLLLERFPLRIDLTSDNRYELTQDSIDFLKDIKEPIDITVCATEQNLSASNEYIKQVLEIMKAYPKYASNIKIEFIDIVKNPNFAKQHPEETFIGGDIYVNSALRGKKININDMIESSQSQQTGQTTYRSKAEQLMTSAIDFVSDTTPVTAVLLTGLDNVDVSGYTELLKTNNYSIQEQNILTEDINPEADFVIFPQPSTDLTKEQADKLDTYLDNGAKYGKSLVFIAAQDRAVGPTLKAFLSEWGMEVGDETIAETEATHVYKNSPFFFLNEVLDADFKTAMNSAQPIVMANAKPIKTLFEKSDNRETKVLVSSYDTAVLIPPTADENFDIEKQEKGAFATVVLGTRLKYDGVTPLKSNLLCISAESMVASALMSQPGFGNGAATISATDTLVEKKESIGIVPVVFQDDAITVNGGQVMLNRMIFVIIIPIGIAIAGLVIWLRRRHL